MPLDPATIIAAGGLSLLGSGLSALGQSSAAKTAARQQRRALDRAYAEGRAGYSDVEEMYQPYMGIGPKALAALATEDFTTPAEAFSYQGEVSDYLDPSMAFQQEQARRALEQSAVARGGLLSTGTAKDLQERAIQLAQTDYGNAYQRMQQDKAFAYQQFRDRAAQRAANAQARYAQLSQLAGIGQQSTGALANARMAAAGQQANIQTQIGAQNAALGAAPYMAASNFAQNLGQIGSGMVNAYAMQQPGGWEYMGNAGVGYGGVNK